MQVPAKQYIKWFMFGAAVLVVAWRVVTVNMADHYVQQATPEAYASALTWRSDHPVALVGAGQARLGDDMGAAQSLLESAIARNPTDGRAFVHLGEILMGLKEVDKAQSAMETAQWLAPQRTDVQGRIAAYLFQNGQVDRALLAWDAVLRHGGSQERLFPVLLKMAEVPEYHSAFGTLLNRPVKWWPAFFRHAAQNALSLDTVRALFMLQKTGPNEVNDVILQSYLARLQKEGMTLEAYMTWLNGLDQEALSVMGNLYNGGFERKVSNVGFDWILRPTPAARIATSSTYGATGNRALNVQFNGQRIRFEHVSQQLMLSPGLYRFRGRVRPDGLQAERGMRWAMYCQGSATPVTTTEAFAGTDQWHHFSAQFSIQEGGCASQSLRLELVGRTGLDFEAEGGIWFDDLFIERVD